MDNLSKPVFRGSGGQWLLKALFFETAIEKDRVLYTLKPEDHTVDGRTLPSLRRLFLEVGDDTGYLFAEKYLGGWPHWKRLMSCNWFVDYLDDIREEMAAKQAAESKMRIREIALDKKDKGSLQANRLLLDGTKGQVGRPSKESIKREAEKMFSDHSDIRDDLARISAEVALG